MKILLTIANAGLETSDFLRSGNIVYDPSLDTAPDEKVTDALVLHGATGLITSRRPGAEMLRRWSQDVTGVKCLSYAAGCAYPPAGAGIVEFRHDGSSLEAIATALGRCERHVALARPVQQLPAPDGAGSREVVLIGAGIVNLITAVRLTEDGFRVTVLDRSPAPGTAPWRAYGCSHGGDDARMFTFTEMDDYHNQDFHGAVPDLFRRPVELGGWLARDPRSLSAEERSWIEEFERVPSWLARTYNEDIFSLSAEAAGEWEHLRRRRPELFEGVVLADGILRVYSDPDHFEAALARHRAIGAVLREQTATELARDHPALARPARDGTLAGGLLVPGFTLNVHKFTGRIIDWLEHRGVRFHWDTEVTRVRRDAAGTVTGFDCPVPLPGTAHVVASPGVYGPELLRGTPCEGKIHGVLGGWTRISNRAGRLGNSLKVGRRGHVTEDANVTVGRDADGQEILIVGSGYGYTGAATEPDERALTAIRLGILDTIERLFPDRAGLGASSAAGDNYAFKYCIRPWTATSLGLYHAEVTSGARLFVINGGHNTGGFAQAPAVARAVLASLSGAPHPMHALYHPERFSAFMTDKEPPVPAVPLPLAAGN
ncbi:FAD-dependent oxidoreductase [Streptoverticillium reticulum]|uniref:NAD(P)/FAD-dependent oxidoreductase n=1 Tax=Streptoverticillium reticulum TaxID=1433415 RepID=UPI0039BFFD5B